MVRRDRCDEAQVEGQRRGRTPKRGQQVGRLREQVCVDEAGSGLWDLLYFEKFSADVELVMDA